MAAIQESSVQFSSVGNEISYFLAHIARQFMGGYSGSGENGIDVSLPVDTPVYAVESGTVVGSGYYAGGGVVSVNSGPGRIWYYQHLDQNELSSGQQVQAGQLIGYSGGQNSGGNHPASPEFSSWPHLEIGINAPWGGIWGNPSGKGNVNPVPYLAALQATNGLTTTNGVPLSASTGNATSSTGATSFNPIDSSTWVPSLESGVLSGLGISSLQDLLWRALFILGGVVVIIVGLTVTFQRQVEEGVGTVIGAGAKAP